MSDTTPNRTTSEREAFECHKLNQRMAGLLNRIAAALKGDPGPHRMHSWHDLPDLAAQAMQAARATQSAQQEQDRIDAGRYRWLRDNREDGHDLTWRHKRGQELAERLIANRYKEGGA